MCPVKFWGIWNCSCQPFVAWRVSECLNISLLNEFRILPWIHSGILIGWMILVPRTCRYQRSHRRKRSRSVEDDEEGHLICQSGDVLSARCIEYFSKLIHFSDRVISFRLEVRSLWKSLSLIFFVLFCVLFFLWGWWCFYISLILIWTSYIVNKDNLEWDSCVTVLEELTN